MNTSNPLMQFARRPELSIKLPSDGNWYEEGFINYTMTGEVEVYPMLPKDELMMLNPDALLSGQANVDLIKSCCPSISDPRKLLYNDVNVILLAIQRATYGNILTMEINCPNCSKIMKEVLEEVQLYNETKSEEEPVKDASKIIAEMEKNGEICIHKQDIDLDIDAIIQDTTFMSKEYVINLDNGLKVSIQPYTLENKAKFGLLSLNQERLYKVLSEYNLEDSLKEDEMSEVRKQLVDCYLNINTYGNQLITSCIKNIVLPDDTSISDKDQILEFISNIDSRTVNKINNEITRITAIGLPEEITYECPCCHYNWKSRFSGFNQVDFFGFGS